MFVGQISRIYITGNIFDFGRDKSWSHTYAYQVEENPPAVDKNSYMGKFWIHIQKFSHQSIELKMIELLNFPRFQVNKLETDEWFNLVLTIHWSIFFLLFMVSNSKFLLTNYPNNKDQKSQLEQFFPSFRD